MTLKVILESDAAPVRVRVYQRADPLVPVEDARGRVSSVEAHTVEEGKPLELELGELAIIAVDPAGVGHGG